MNATIAAKRGITRFSQENTETITSSNDTDGYLQTRSNDT